MKITNSSDFGEIIRQTRRSQKLRQKDLAAASGCSEKFIVDLEKGKPTCELQKALHIALMLGIQIGAKLPGDTSLGANK
ncbi:MAG: helix-turn-helix transcriptional regulator [Cyanobacteria bacterium TGS_CYA1]|nr:helix-turn-helix transcriptional regulator [Cyanobacteria bacterium TGS_CYA1]